MPADKYPSIFSRQMEAIVYTFNKIQERISCENLLSKIVYFLSLGLRYDSESSQSFIEARKLASEAAAMFSRFSQRREKADFELNSKNIIQFIPAIVPIKRKSKKRKNSAVCAFH